MILRNGFASHFLNLYLGGAVFSVIFHVTAKSAKIADKLSVVFGHFIFSLYLD